MKTLIYGSIKGLLREIDPHSRFFAPGEMKKFKEEIKGKFYGVGIEVGRKNGLLTVISVIKDSPAAGSGLQAGDQIFKVNGKAVKDFTVWEFSEIFKDSGEREIIVLRPGVREPLAFSVKSSVIKFPSLHAENLPGKFLYIRIHYFSQTTLLEINKILRGHSPEGLLLDLRGNPGGVFEQAVQIADLFLDEGLIVSYKIKGKAKPRAFSAKFSDTLPFFPVAVLIDEYSASASEVLAGALKDHKRALLIGRKSFGKGSIQNIFPLPGESALKLTVGEYQTPSGRLIHGQGIEPHITVEKKPEKKERGASPAGVLGDFEAAQAFQQLKKIKAQGKDSPAAFL